MRLINVETEKLVSFSLDDAPPYAILSHTWSQNDADELTVRDILEGTAKNKTFGYTKLGGFELGEAINSMFKWYQHAAVCYVYLSDVKSEDQLPASRWFTRGWTLQELIAPSNVKFYASNWHFLEAITGIPEEFLHGDGHFLQASVAQRMSWASGRSTKREKEMAYCLLGIFDVSVPILYGDSHAFAKVQEAIMAKNRDDSIFAWGLEPTSQASHTLPATSNSAGAFAMEPADFGKCGNRLARFSKYAIQQVLYRECLRLHQSLPHTLEDGSTFGLLSCEPEDDSDKVVGIPLIPDPSGSFFYRPQDASARLFSKSAAARNTSIRPIYLQLLHDQPPTIGSIDRRNWFRIRTAGTGLKILEAFPPERLENGMVKTSKDNDGTTERTWLRLVQQKNRDSALDFVLVLDFQILPDSTPSAHCHVMVSDSKTSLQSIATSRFASLQTSFGQCQASNEKLHISSSVTTVNSETRSGQPTFVVSLTCTETPFSNTLNATRGMHVIELLPRLITVMKQELRLSHEKKDFAEREAT
ncbi:hypothetical protein QBC38DRAFT_518820 [Podospora fimiseda]|uniref:HET domain-containing protein n=1 Tax=Podospora fimiseda TaxID=252190 RepID=A0AAN6YPJ9_9PEZI|nr:hypothetical protein QBC38DRAFT_518820 [Podospora fimiseda]